VGRLLFMGILYVYFVGAAAVCLANCTNNFSSSLHVWVGNLRVLHADNVATYYMVASGEIARRTHKMPRLIGKLIQKKHEGWPIRRVRFSFSSKANNSFAPKMHQELVCRADIFYLWLQFWQRRDDNDDSSSIVVVGLQKCIFLQFLKTNVAQSILWHTPITPYTIFDIP
jgi:hypothetical protein